MFWKVYSFYFWRGSTMVENKKTMKIILIIIMGILLIVLLVFFLMLQIKQKTETLSKEKMLAIKNSMVYEYNANDLDGSFEAETDCMAEISDFNISTGTQPKVIVGAQQEEKDITNKLENKDQEKDTANQIGMEIQSEDIVEDQKENTDITDGLEDKVQERDTINDLDNNYLCSYSSDRLLDEADIEELGQNVIMELPDDESAIQMVINEMYARYGYQFKSEEIQQYFESKQWYQDIDERFEDMDIVFGKMTETEQTNVKFLSAHMED